MVHQTADDLLAHFLKVKLQLFTSFSIHGVSNPILALASLPHVSTWHKSQKINWSFTHLIDWSGQYWCTAGSARQFPPAAERGHVHTRIVGHWEPNRQT